MSPRESEIIASVMKVVNVPLQHALDGQETLRKQIEELSRALIVQQERVSDMSKDVDEMKQKLEEVKKAIIDNQERKFRQTIAAQATILVLIVGGAITYFFQFLHH